MSATKWMVTICGVVVAVVGLALIVSLSREPEPSCYGVTACFQTQPEPSGR